MTGMAKISMPSILLLALLAAVVVGVRIEKGFLTLDVVTGDSSQEHKVEYNNIIRDSLTLTQSSKINIKARMTFSKDDFVPEFFAFRLRNPQYDNLTEPVLATYDGDRGQFSAVIDLGDPKQISHMSGDYRLEIIISDDRFESQVRHYVANCKVTFRHSLEQPRQSDLQYTVPSIIMTQPPATRVDPPAIFTAFIVVVMGLLFAIFIWGLNYQKANINFFPTDGTGMIMNVVFLGCLGLVFFVLFKFWLSWTFIETIQFSLLGILPVSFAANYAFVHIKRA